MIDQQLFSELAEKLFNNLPNNQNLNSIKEDVTKTFKVVLEQSFNRLDLVTRQEFDIQCKVLDETRAELKALEKKLINLEKK